MTLVVTHCVTAVPTYPIYKHRHKPPRSFSLRILSKSNQVSDVKTPQSTSYTIEPIRECECFNMYKQQVPYSQAWAWQKSIVEEKKAMIEKNDHCRDSLFVLQHRPVLLVQNSSLILISRTHLLMFIELNVAARLHIMVRVRSLEEVIIRALSKTFCIKASRLEGLTGVWHGNQKLAAIGIRVSQWIAYHGLAVNVNPDLTHFRWIVPCGLQGYQVGSVKSLLEEFHTSADCGRADLPDPDDCQLLDITCRSLINEFSEVFEVRINYETMSRLDLQAL